jgi:dolichol kinase
MWATIERLLSMFSMSFQGMSLVVNIDAVLYAYVSLLVLLVQLWYESGKPQSDNTLLSRTLTASASTMCVLSVASNFFDPDVQTIGRFLTMAGLVQEAMLFGIEIGKSKNANDFFALERATSKGQLGAKPSRRKKRKDA